MTEAVLYIVAILAVGAAWTWWGDRRGVDEAHEARETAYAGRLARRMLLATAVLAVSLVLDALDVAGAAYIALVAFLALMALFVVGPLLGPRRRRR